MDNFFDLGTKLLKADNRVFDVFLLKKAGTIEVYVSFDHRVEAIDIDCLREIQANLGNQIDKEYSGALTADFYACTAIRRNVDGSIDSAFLDKIKNPETRGEFAVRFEEYDRMPLVSLVCVKNLFIRQMLFRKSGDCEVTHEHCFDHVTLLSRGSLEVTVNGQKTVFDAKNSGCAIYIKANMKHRLVALEDNTLAYCIHALRSTDVDGDIIDPSSIPSGVDYDGLLRNLLSDKITPPIKRGNKIRSFIY